MMKKIEIYRGTETREIPTSTMEVDVEVEVEV